MAPTVQAKTSLVGLKPGTSVMFKCRWGNLAIAAGLRLTRGGAKGYPTAGWVMGEV